MPSRDLEDSRDGCEQRLTSNVGHSTKINSRYTRPEGQNLMTGLKIEVKVREIGPWKRHIGEPKDYT